MLKSVCSIALVADLLSRNENYRLHCQSGTYLDQSPTRLPLDMISCQQFLMAIYAQVIPTTYVCPRTVVSCVVVKGSTCPVAQNHSAVRIILVLWHIFHQIFGRIMSESWRNLSPEATVTQRLIWKWGVSKQGILKSPVSHVLNFLGWIWFIFDTAYLCNFVIL